MSRTWKRPEGHGRGVGDWRGKGMEYAHYFRPSHHIGSFRDYYSGNYGYDDDTRFEYEVSRGRVRALGASPNEDRPSRGRIRPNFNSHLRSRSGMRDKGIRRDFERERFYDNNEFAPEGRDRFYNDKKFVPKSNLFYNDDNSLDDDVPYEGEEERQPEDYFFYLMKCRGDRKKVFTHALAVDKKANDTPEDISDYVNEQLNSNPNLTSKYGSSIKILKVTLCSDYNKWYKSLNANGIDPDDVIWVEDGVEENSEETVDMEAADFNYGDDVDDSYDIPFEEFKGFVSEYDNMLIDYNRDKNLGSYSNIMNALKDAGYHYINDCPCYDFVASESWDEWEESREKYFDDAADEAIETLIEIFPNVYEGSEIPSITPTKKKELIEEVIYEEIQAYLRSKLGSPHGEENEEFETRPANFTELKDCVDEYLAALIEYDDLHKSIDFIHVIDALKKRGYRDIDSCPCMSIIKCEDESEWENLRKEVKDTINLCMELIPDVVDGLEPIKSITSAEYNELYNFIYKSLRELMDCKYEIACSNYAEDGFESDDIAPR